MESGKDLAQEKIEFDIFIIRPQVLSEYFKLRRDGFAESRRMAYNKNFRYVFKFMRG